MMRRLHTLAILAFYFLCLPSSCFAETRRRVIQENGFAIDEFSFIVSPEMPSEQIEKVTILTEDTYIITSSSSSMSGMNVSVVLEAENDVGPAHFVVSVQTNERMEPYNYPYTLDVVGISISDADGRVLSGEQGPGLIFKDYNDALESKTLTAKAYSGDGIFEDFSEFTVQVLNDNPEGKKLLEDGDVVKKDGFVVISPNPFLTGTAKIELEHPSVVLDDQIGFTTMDVVVPEVPFPDPYRIVTMDEPRLVNNSLPATSVEVSIGNLVGRPDTGPFETLTGYVNMQPIFAMDRARTNLTRTGDQRIVLAYAPNNEALSTGDYNVTLEAEYSDDVKTVRQISPLQVSVVDSIDNVGTLQDVTGIISNFSWITVIAVTGCALLVAGLASLAMWRRSVNRSERVESGYASGSESQGGSEGALGQSGSTRVVGVPSIQSSDSIVRDSYARNDSTFSGSLSESDYGTGSGPEFRSQLTDPSLSLSRLSFVREYDGDRSTSTFGAKVGTPSSATGDDSYALDTDTSSSSFGGDARTNSAFRRELFNNDSETSSWFQQAANERAIARATSDGAYPSSNFSRFF